MEIIIAARILRASFVRPSRRQPKRSKLGFALGASFALLAMSPLAMTDAQAITVVGTIAGSAGVSATGEATYTIPITVPPGTHSMQPSLALTYSSRSGDGVEGFGWTISGLSSITRCAWDKEDDGETLPIQYTAADDYCLDGQRLVLLTGTQGHNGATYGTQIEKFSLITSFGGSWGPGSFTVQTKDGRTYEYGNTADSAIYAVGLTKGSNIVRTWALDKVTDADGNYITYTYNSNSFGTDYAIKQIAYTGNGSNVPDHTVAFAYSSRSPGYLTAAYQAGALIANTRLLNTITVTTGSVSYSYSLTYGSDPVNSREQLQSVQECGTDGSCMAPTTIAWQNAQAGWGPDVDTGVGIAGKNFATGAHLMDVDGDGIQDLVFGNSNVGDWMVMFGQPGGGFGHPVDTGDALIGVTQYSMALDYNGDGMMDLAVPMPGIHSWELLQATGNRAAGGGNIFHVPSNNLPDLSANNSATGEPIYEGNVWPVSFTGNGAASDVVYSDGVHLEMMNNSGPASGDNYSSPTAVYTGTGLGRFETQVFSDVGVDFDGSTRAGGLILDIQSSGDTWLGLTQNSADTALTVMDSISTIPSSNGQPFYAIPMDANGDGQTDVFSADARGVLLLSLSTGDGFIPLTEGLYQSTAASDPVVADYYADGRKEAIVKVTGPAWDILDNYFSTAGYFKVSQTGYGSSPYANSPYTEDYVQGSLRVGNISASGLDDLVYGVSTGSTTFDWHYRLHMGGAADLVTSITDGLGNVASFQYASLSDGSVYTKGTGAVYPIQDIQPTMQVVSKYTFAPAAAAAYDFTYSYSTARTDTNGRGFLGFGSRTITDSRNGNMETIGYSQKWPWTGMIISDVLTKSTGDEIRDTENTGADNLALTGRKFPFFDTSTTTDYDFVSGTVQPIRVTTTTLSQSSFDSYGNVLTSSTTVGQPGSPPPAPTFSSTTTVQYATPGSTYCVSLPTQDTAVRQNPAGSLSRIITASEDATHCQPNSRTVASGETGDGTPPLTTTYALRDAFGNVTEVDESGSGIGTRKTTYSFMGGNDEFPTTSTNVVSGTLSFASHATWNYALGVELTSNDPNGNQTTMTYDGFGRLTTVTRPDGGGYTVAYAACPGAGAAYCPSGAAYEATTSAFNDVGGTGKVTILTGYTAYDSLGRAIEQGTVLLGGGISRVDTVYDALGDVVSVSKPFTGAAPSFNTTYTYDLALGRVTAASTPQHQSDTCSPTCGDLVTYGYNGLTTTTTQTVTDSASSSSSHSAQRTTDLIGEIVNSMDTNGGSTSHAYDSFGDLISTTDADGKVSATSYDGLGYRTGMADPNLGAWAYQVDALGELTCQTDAKLQSMIMSYDGVGRLTNKTETSPQTGPDCTPAVADIVYTGAWAYDTASHGLGLPGSLTDSNGFSRSYDYDAFSRTADVTTVPGSGAASYVMSTAYDTFGRTGTLTYPATVTGAARFAVNYNYDSSSGVLSSISDAATNFVYWQVATGGGSAPVDSFGHILGYVDGNGVSTVTAYDQATGAMLGFNTGSGTSASIQQLAYSWDGFGNLKQRCDANRGLVETAAYDGLDRLSASSVYSGGTTGSCTAGTTVGAVMNLTYDAMGNIQTRTNTGITVGTGTQNDTYSYDSAHPYAVHSVTSVPGTYTYDADGNMTAGNGRTVAWNDDNLPVSVTSTGTVDGDNLVTGTSTLSYSPDMRRYQQVATGIAAGTTIYVGSLFEVVTTSSSTEYRQSIMAADGVVATHTVTQSGTTTTTANGYIHSDHLGSVDVITDDTGAVAVDAVTGEPQQMSFDAFGLRRNPADWSYNVNVGGLKAVTDRGFTFQEQLDNVALVHMNGRVYDPTIGRFISADPLVSGDRYAYLDNNPLDDTDPTGYCGMFDPICITKKVVGTAVNIGKDGLSAGKNLLKDGADDQLDLLRDGADLQLGLLRDGADLQLSLLRDGADLQLGLLRDGADFQLDIAKRYTEIVGDVTWEYTHDVHEFISANISLDKHWTQESITFAANPAMNIEYSFPLVGNWFNVRMSHSKRLQKLGADVADAASGYWGEEIDGGYAAYLAAINGDDDDISLLRIGGRTTVVDWLRDETGCKSTVKACAESKAKSWGLDGIEDWLGIGD